MYILLTLGINRSVIKVHRNPYISLKITEYVYPNLIKTLMVKIQPEIIVIRLKNI